MKTSELQQQFPSTSMRKDLKAGIQNMTSTKIYVKSDIPISVIAHDFCDGIGDSLSGL